MRRYAILTQGRSGSTYLRTVLDAHPQLVNFGEVLGEWTEVYKCERPREEAIGRYLASFFGRTPRLEEHVAARGKDPDAIVGVGIKDFFFNIERRRASGFFLDNTDIAIVYLVRDNLLERHVSLLVQHMTGVDHSENPAPLTPLRLDPDAVVAGLDVLSRERDFEQALVERLRRTHAVVDLRYDEYFACDDSIDRHNRRLFEFLGVEPREIRGRFKKIVPRDLRAVVADYDELCRRLRRTRYACYLLD